jgi:hypothetical protein
MASSLGLSRSMPLLSIFDANYDGVVQTLTQASEGTQRTDRQTNVHPPTEGLQYQRPGGSV